MQQKQELNSGVIFTNPNCIGCNKCVSGCIAVGANVVVNDPVMDRHTVMVDPNKCIVCGTCVESCVHHARTYRDDTEEFFRDLKNGEEISILISATFLTNYETKYHNVLGYLKQLGVKHIYNTGFGGDVMVWAYMNLIKDFGLSGVISQFCPVIVNYLEKYKPELLENLMPVQSPLMCTAIYVNDYLKNNDKLAYISPCIAGKYEIDDVNTYGKVSYHVTFERLMKHIEGVNISQYTADDEIRYGLGALIPMSGGLSDNIKQYIGFNEVLIQTAGPNNIFPYFDHYYKEVDTGGRLPFLVDALSCTNGCNFGTATNCGVELRNQMTFSAHQVKENAYTMGKVSTGRNYQERLQMLNEQFQQFELSSFVRQYDSTRKIVQPVLLEDEIESIYQSMYKYTSPQRHTDCGACGYQTCREMVYAIGTNINHKENCINYSKECIRQETEKINNLLAEISKMNEELKRSTQLKSNFLANMSHEIRTPMNAIIGMAEMALRGDLPNEERSYLQQIKSSGRSLLAIINDILDFSKIESGKMEINESEYKVMSIINDTVNIVQTRIGEKNISLIVDADPHLPFTLFGDDIRIKQVLVNLANNAVKFTQEGYVKISLHQEKYGEEIRLCVAVEDSGSGIKPEDLDKLFTSFQQVDSKRNRNVEGTGLGLVISREFVKLMNGEIHVESKYGKGSIFSFWIPQKIVDDIPSVQLKQQDTAVIATYIENEYVRGGFLKAIDYFPQIQNISCSSVESLEAAVRVGATSVFIDYSRWNHRIDEFAKNCMTAQVVVILDQRKDVISVPYVRKLNQPAYSLSIVAALNHEEMEFYVHDVHEKEFRFEAPTANVLIVDDNAINLTVAKGLLSPFHMKISCASGGREAIQMIEENAYDIVFMDHMMPEIDGVEATHMIREREGDYYQNLPIVALTANAINNAREMFLSEGMNDFVAKPIEMMDITAKLRKWLPPEKISYLGEKESGKAEEKQEEALVIEGLDVSAGVALSGTMELYRIVLCDYYKVIEKKAALIEGLQASGDILAYTIEVHALKSASKLVGALKLSEMAARLEKCGNEKDWETIQAETPEMLRFYRSYSAVLEPYFRADHEDAEKCAVEPLQLIEHLEIIYQALDDFDIDSAAGIMKQLDGALLDETAAALCHKLHDAIESMEYDEAGEIALEWKKLLEAGQ